MGMATATKPTTMKGAQYQKLIDSLGLSQVDSAIMLGVNDRTVRRWVVDYVPIPHAVAILLTLMKKKKIKPGEVAELIKKGGGLPKSSLRWSSFP